MYLITFPIPNLHRSPNTVDPKSLKKSCNEFSRNLMLLSSHSLNIHTILLIVFADPDVHLDNGVHSMLLTAFGSKLERLAFECSRPEAQENCLPGQKWRCEREGRRWRRHKCRYTAPPQPIQVSQRVTKKCACFTPNGVVYTRLETNDSDGHKLTIGKEQRAGNIYGDEHGYLTRRGKSVQRFEHGSDQYTDQVWHLLYLLFLAVHSINRMDYIAD